LRDMLLYISHRVLQEGATEIHEQEIGYHVFGRERNYDTATDNTVRVHASMLRKRLEQYFATEGAGEPVVMELPKGNYAPVFKDRSATEKKESETVFKEGATQWWRRAAWGLGLAAIALGASTVWLATTRSAVRADPLAGKPSVAEFWSAIFQRGQATDVVLDDAAIGLYQELTGQMVRLSEYYDRSYLRGLGAAPSGKKLDPDTAGQIVLKRQSSFAYVNAMGRLGPLAARFGTEIRLVFARDYSFQALKSDNAVLMGHRRTNPWVEPFEAAIGVRWEFDATTQGYYPVDTWAAAEQDAKRPLIGRRDGQDGYALIAMLPNLRGTGRVLLMSATGGSALSVAGEFLEDETSVRTLRTRIGANERPFPYFEVLLRVPARSRRPGDVEMVVCRRAAARSVKGLK